jgi:hypothetical protein
MTEKKREPKMRQMKAAPAPAPADSSPEFIGSPRSQRNIKEQWRLEGELKTCDGQIACWQRKLATAEEGVRRNTGGGGYNLAVLRGYVREANETKDMITSFEAHAVTLRAELAALLPDAAKAAERGELQKIVAAQIRARLALDKRLDSALEAARAILLERAELTRKMRDGAVSLEFNQNVDLDEGRFDSLLAMLPRNMAAESQKFCDWFLGEEGDRRPYAVRNDGIVFKETLRAANAFREGDSPELTDRERAEIERMVAARGPFAPPVEEPPKRLLGEPAAEIASSEIQWALLR